MGDRGEQARGQGVEAAERPVSGDWQDEPGMEHLRDGAPYRVCNVCGRMSWGHAFADSCAVPQPNGLTCPGTFGERFWPDTDEPQGSSPTSSPGESGEGGGAGLDLDRLAEMAQQLIDEPQTEEYQWTNAVLASTARDVLALVARVRVLEAVAEAARAYIAAIDHRNVNWTAGSGMLPESVALRAALAAAGGGAHE